MSTDRKLLQKAAKAAGYNVDWLDENANAGRQSGGFYFGVGSYTPCRWNPLTDDGDALRLAVKLGLCFDAGAHTASDGGPNRYGQVGERDPYAATRRAIVRAAAALGDQHG